MMTTINNNNEFNFIVVEENLITISTCYINLFPFFTVLF